jgi:copper chaperone CopZ
VTLLTERAEVAFDSAVLSPKDIVELVEDVGFTAVEEDKTTIVLNIGGMTCAACVGTVENVLLDTPGVTQVKKTLFSFLFFFSFFFFFFFFFSLSLSGGCKFADGKSQSHVWQKRDSSAGSD